MEDTSSCQKKQGHNLRGLGHLPIVEKFPQLPFLSHVGIYNKKNHNNVFNTSVKTFRDLEHIKVPKPIRSALDLTPGFK